MPRSLTHITRHRNRHLSQGQTSLGYRDGVNEAVALEFESGLEHTYTELGVLGQEHHADSETEACGVPPSIRSDSSRALLSDARRGGVR